MLIDSAARPARVAQSSAAEGRRRCRSVGSRGARAAGIGLGERRGRQAHRSRAADRHGRRRCRPCLSLVRASWRSACATTPPDAGRSVGPLGEERQDQRFELVRDQRVAQLRPVGHRGIMLRHDRRPTAR